MDINISSQIVVQTAAQWAADATVYSAKRLLVTSDAYYLTTDQRKFKIADGVQTWSNLDYFPLDLLVPYTGATSDVNIGIYKLIAAALQANSSAGATIKSSAGADVALFGAGGGQNVTFYDGVKLDASTASRILSTDASKNITALDTATYPSLVELAYLKGVTSAIQTQLDAKPTQLIVPFHCDASNPATATNQANAEQFLVNSSRNIVKVDLSKYTQVRLTTRVVTGSVSVNNPRLYVEYYVGSFSTTVSDYLDIGTSAVSTSIASTGMIDSGWINMVAGAKVDNVFLTILQNGGDGAADPSFGLINVQFR
jgi:hypothetical protein